MKQPALGKKIADLRKTKGLTQEELVEQCNISVRTLQRIESGEVSPRSYTLKSIFEVLEYKPSNTLIINTNQVEKWYEQIKLFLSKPKTMKSTIIILAVSLAFSIILFAFKINNSNNQTDIVNARKAIEKINKNYQKWYNTGYIDSCLTAFSEDVCLINNWIIVEGKKNVEYRLMNAQPQGYKIMDHNIETFHCNGNLAVVRGTSAVKSPSGKIIIGKYIEEWQYVGGRWLKVNQIDSQH